MNKFAFIGILAFMVLAVNAQGETSENDQKFLTCAKDKWSKMFFNITFIQGSMTCLEGVEGEEADKAREMIGQICDNIKGFEKYYEEEEDSVEKYKYLYEQAEGVLKDNEKFREQVANLDPSVQECVKPELQKAIDRIGKAKECKTYLNQEETSE